jgi:phenylacetate-CoA ligase
MRNRTSSTADLAMETPIHAGAARKLGARQQRKLRKLLLDAWRNVPMYRSLYEALGLTERDLSDPQTFRSLPILTKRQLVATPLAERVNRRFDPSVLAKETTAGSTGEPFSLCIDARYRWARNLRFLRGLTAVGYRPWHRLLLLTDRHAGLSRRFRWHYQSIDAPAEAILDAYLGVRPDVLYGFTNALRLLASGLSCRPPGKPPGLVVTTAEMLDPSTRQLLEQAFHCPVLDFYGLTEMGLVAWQRPGKDEYVMSDGVLTELVPDESCQDRYRTVMTNLDLRATPMIRFDAGDLACAEYIDGVPRITAFEGRVIDALVCRDGTRLSPYRLTDALQYVAGVKRFKVTQRELAAIDIDLEADTALRNQAISEITAIFHRMLGPELDLRFNCSDRLVSGMQKFRPVESLVLPR